MQVTRKIVAAAAVATVATLGLATVVSANVLDDAQQKAQVTGLADSVSAASKDYKGGPHWAWVKKDGSLVAIDDNNVGPVQACHNFGSATGIGGNVPVSDVVGIVGWGNDGNSVTAVKTCEQDNEQNNRKWVKADKNGLISVSNNNLGPWQVCHNEISGTGIGGNVPLTNLSGILGFDNDGNSVDTLKTCEQDSEQNN
ncbi:hypothetical protein [Kribbella sp. HUAS MG21]|jgi:hypothetical protein|uniref:Secreted protein n=1 Tax=Kribbella sp. HUAS MG21 TaxID=3160966 RepID=A0AAU7TLB2_9ACTN